MYHLLLSYYHCHLLSIRGLWKIYSAISLMQLATMKLQLSVLF